MFGRKRDLSTLGYPFTDRVRQTLQLTREEVIRLKHEYIGTEHILLGLLRHGGGVAAAVLSQLKIDRDDLRQRIEGSVKKGTGRYINPAPFEYTSRAKQTLLLAARESRQLGQTYVGTEHLLLGLLAEGKGVAAQVLGDAGVTLERARVATAQLLRTKGGGVRDTAFQVTIDDDADQSIYEQIIAQMQEAIATGTLRAGTRLPAVRQLADELDIAPGTVARAYSELERRRAVVTDGARGTRVADRSGPAVPPGQRPETLVGLMRPVVVAGFHLGASATELRHALDEAMRGIYGGGSDPTAA